MANWSQDAIPRGQQGKVLDFVNKFRADPTRPGIHYEKIHGAKDPHLRSVRIDGTYRGIVFKPDTGNVQMLLWVVNLDKWVSDFRRRNGYHFEVDFGRKTGPLWQTALTLAPTELGLGAAFYREEWERVVQPQEVTTLEDYLASAPQERTLRPLRAPCVEPSPRRCRPPRQRPRPGPCRPPS